MNHEVSPRPKAAARSAASSSPRPKTNVEATPFEVLSPVPNHYDSDESSDIDACSVQRDGSILGDPDEPITICQDVTPKETKLKRDHCPSPLPEPSIDKLKEQINLDSASIKGIEKKKATIIVALGKKRLKGDKRLRKEADLQKEYERVERHKQELSFKKKKCIKKMIDKSYQRFQMDPNSFRFDMKEIDYIMRITEDEADLTPLIRSEPAFRQFLSQFRKRKRLM